MEAAIGRSAASPAISRTPGTRIARLAAGAVFRARRGRCLLRIAARRRLGPGLWYIAEQRRIREDRGAGVALVLRLRFVATRSATAGLSSSAGFCVRSRHFSVI